jgi:hypothetical protein
LEKDTIITTGAYAREVQVDAIDGSASLSPESSSLFDDDYDYGWLSDGDRIFRILNANNSLGEVQLDSEWIGSSEESANVYIWQDSYDLPTDFSEIIAVIPRALPGKKPLRQVPLENIDAETVEIYRKKCETAYKYCIFRETDKTTRYRLRIFPPPDREVEYVVKYYALPIDLDSSDSEPLLPEKHHTTLSDLARLRLVKERREDVDVIQNCEIEAQKGLVRLWKDQHRSKGITYQFGRRGSTRAKYLPFRPVNVNSDSP